MLERYDPKLEVFVFYAHSFWVLGRFACLVRTLTCLRDMTRNSSFSRFMAVFMIYCPLFWGYREIYNDIRTRYMFDSYDQKLVIFVFYVHFHELLPTFFGFLKDLPASEEPLHVFRDMTRNSSFSRLWPF